MQKISFLVLVLSIFLAGPSRAETDVAEPKQNISGPATEYQVSAGDVLLVSVWDEPNLNGEVVVLPDFTISFPLVGVLDVSGKSIFAIKNMLTEKLSTYIPEAHVHVALQQVRGSKFYVIGKVNRPGEFPLDKRTSVLQALSVAGGLNAFADEDGIKVIRTLHDEQHAIAVDYSELIKGESLDRNIALYSGDVVVVP